MPEKETGFEMEYSEVGPDVDDNAPSELSVSPQASEGLKRQRSSSENESEPRTIITRKLITPHAHRSGIYALNTKVTKTS